MANLFRIEILPVKCLFVYKVLKVFFDTSGNTGTDRECPQTGRKQKACLPDLGLTRLEKAFHFSIQQTSTNSLRIQNVLTPTRNV